MKNITVFLILALLVVFTLAGTAYSQDDEVVEIEYWDQNFSPETEAVIEGLIANFEEANPGITVRREILTLQVMTDIARTVFEAGEGPDIIYFDSGPAYGGVLANAGLILPLDDAYEEFGWDERLIPFSRDWTTFGGHVYGVGHEFEAQGLYWNKNIFADEGLEPPATFGELLELCRTFRERGYDVPMAGGWASFFGFNASHNWYNVLANYVDRDTIAAAISGEHPWNDPEIVAAMELFTDDMHDAGCYDDLAPGVSFLDGNNMLYVGQAPMMLMSTWAMQFFTDEITDEFGFMVMPPIEEGGDQTMIQLVGAVWYINSDTEHPEETLRFLDYLVSEEAVRVWVEEAALLPAVAGVDFSAYDVRPVYRDFINLLSGWDGPVGYHLDVLTPAGMTNVMWEGMTEVTAGRLSAQELADRMQEQMERDVEDGDFIDITDD